MNRTFLTAIAVAAAALTSACGGGSSPASAKVVNPGASSTTSATSTPSATPTPTTVALPVLSGAYKVVVIVTQSNTEKQPAGTKVTRTWKFTPLCPDPTCGVTLSREVGWATSGGSTTKYFSSTANRTSNGYKGVEHKPQQCPLPSGKVVTGPEQATLTYTIVVKARPGARPTFSGTATNSAPAEGGCRAVIQTLSFSGVPA